ncbi:MAG: hypothetical protein EKK53_15425 [Burkholderiales bacterium]|nr:MAG: hypothetical protein EKK53_15425 [Burkholderiales bacterium]
MTVARSYFRRRAIERRRDPSQDARNDAAAAAMRARVEQQLAQLSLIQKLADRVQRDTPSAGIG